MKITTEYGKVGEEARKAAQRVAIRTAMMAARGDVAEAGRALGIDRRKVGQLAREVGLDWEALCAESRAEESTEPSSNVA